MKKKRVLKIVLSLVMIVAFVSATMITSFAYSGGFNDLQHVVPQYVTEVFGQSMRWSNMYLDVNNVYTDLGVPNMINVPIALDSRADQGGYRPDNYFNSRFEFEDLQGHYQGSEVYSNGYYSITNRFRTLGDDHSVYAFYPTEYRGITSWFNDSGELAYVAAGAEIGQYIEHVMFTSPGGYSVYNSLTDRVYVGYSDFDEYFGLTGMFYETLFQFDLVIPVVYVNDTDMGSDEMWVNYQSFSVSCSTEAQFGETTWFTNGFQSCQITSPYGDVYEYDLTDSVDYNGANVYHFAYDMIVRDVEIYDEGDYQFYNFGWKDTSAIYHPSLYLSFAQMQDETIIENLSCDPVVQLYQEGECQLPTFDEAYWFDNEVEVVEVDLWEWIFDAIQGVLNIELFGSLTVGHLLLSLIAIPVVLAILKLIAGG